MRPADLPATWRIRAVELRPYAPAAAEAFVRAADELAQALRESADENLTLAEASAESGYSVRRLRELVASGEIDNAGRKGAPRIRRGNLPRRPGRSNGVGGYDPDVDAGQLVGTHGAR